MSFEEWTPAQQEAFDRHYEKSKERLNEPEHETLHSCREVYLFLLDDMKAARERGEESMMEKYILGSVSRYTLPGGEQCWAAPYLGRPAPSDRCGIQIIAKRDGQYVFIEND